MRIIIQRISSARLICKQPASKQISKEIGRGIVALVGIESAMMKAAPLAWPSVC